MPLAKVRGLAVLVCLTTCVAGLCVCMGCQLGVPPDPSALPPPTTDKVSFANDVLPTFQQHCVVCHQDGGLALLAGMHVDLAPADAYNTTVNQHSVQDPNLTIIQPGDASSSLLFEKITSKHPPVGLPMPLIGIVV